jgi:hypothetical protein
MPTTNFTVTLHHLAPGASAAGLAYPDEQLNDVTLDRLRELLLSLEQVASRLTIYEPSSPEIRIKTDRETFVVRTRYRQLCFVGRESLLRGEPHTIPFIVATVTGEAVLPVTPVAPTRTYERPPSAPPAAAGESLSAAPWMKIAVLLVLIACCLGGGLWMLFKPARGVAPKFTYLNATESSELLARVAGEYRTGTGEGDRRLIIAADGTMRLAKYGAAQAIAEEIIRSARGARQDGQLALATSDPYVMLVRDPDGLQLYGQTYRRVVLQ